MALQSPPRPSTTCGLDFLYCHEEIWVDVKLNNFKVEEEEREPSSTTSSSGTYIENDDDDDQQLVDLISKEEKEQISLDLTPLIMLGSSIRRDVIEWMMMVNAHHGFSTLTLVLAVNYFDRFILGSSSQAELLTKIPNLDAQRIPWVTELASIACLSLASKFEETHVPLLLNFQIGCKHSFDAKTIRRMELLVLSTLEWKMNPVTPFSYFEHLARKIKWKTNLQQEILWRSQRLVLSFIAEPGYTCYTPSIVAAAVVLHAMRELGHFNPMESEYLLMDALSINKNKIEDCCRFISEMSSNNRANKRRRICSSFSGSIRHIAEEPEEGFCRWRISYSESIDQVAI